VAHRGNRLVSELLLANIEYYNVGMSTRELIDRELDVLPEPLQREVYDFVRFIKSKANETFNGLLASESVLGRDWNTPEEDAAWQNL
jgi:hypothetical protein